MKHGSLRWIALAALGVGCSSREGSPVMDRAALLARVQEFADAAFIAGVPPSLAVDAVVTENGARIELADSVLRGSQSIPYRLPFAEAAAGQVALYGVAVSGEQRTIFSLRLREAAAGISEVEIVTARPGEASIAAPEQLRTPPALYEEILPPARRSSRAQLIAAADAYFSGLEQANGDLPPFHPDCDRYENGARMTNAGEGLRALSCRDGLFALDYIRPIRDRRFPIVDEEHGLVWGLAVFDIRGGPWRVERAGRVLVDRVQAPRSILIGELFRIEAGRITRIDVVMRNAPLGAGAGW